MWRSCEFGDNTSITSDSGADGRRFYHLLWSLVRLQGEDWLEEKTRREQETTSRYQHTQGVFPDFTPASDGTTSLFAV